MRQYGDTLVYTTLMAIFSYIGIYLKKMIENLYNERVKKEVVEVVCKAVNQVYSNLSGQEKLKKAMSNVTEILEEKNIFITELEIRLIIESTVNSFKKEKIVKEGN